MNPNDQPVNPSNSDPGATPVPPASEQPAVPESAFPPQSAPQPAVSDVSPQPAMTSNGGQPMQPIVTNPGRGLGIAGFVVSLVSLLLNFVTFGILSVVGLVLSIIAKVKSKRAGQPNGLALAGIIISIVSCVLTLALFALTMLVGVQGLSRAKTICQEKGDGVYVQGNTQITCGPGGSVNVQTSKGY